jgi:EAL domain-containing protein (putative c-di-GMP-specific phosphodiesterase class I)
LAAGRLRELRRGGHAGAAGTIERDRRRHEDTRLCEVSGSAFSGVLPLLEHQAGWPPLGEALPTHRLAPERLELEITEGVLIKDVEQALATLRQLKALGVRIAMDDFGTGYSSLSYLQRFPFDKIKIDRSFIEAMRDTTESVAIVRAVTGLGQGLKIPVIAEGVETVEQMDLLRREHCNEIQGYLIGQPIALDADTDILAAVRAAQALLDAAVAPARSAGLVLAQAG